MSPRGFVLNARYSNLILNLFSLMVDANIPDIALEPDKTVKKVKPTASIASPRFICTLDPTLVW